MLVGKTAVRGFGIAVLVAFAACTTRYGDICSFNLGALSSDAGTFARQDSVSRLASSGDDIPFDSGAPPSSRSARTHPAIVW